MTLLEMLSTCSVVDLEHTRGPADPVLPIHRPGLIYRLRRLHEPGSGESRTSASGFFLAAEHSGTHIDAHCHQAEHLHIYGGIKVTPKVQSLSGFTKGAVDSIPPILARGVLLDVADLNGQVLPEGYQISPQELEKCECKQGVMVQSGDVVLVRTGYGRFWNDPASYECAAGMSAEASLWLAERNVLAVGIDNLSWDVVGVMDPATNTTLPGHVILLIRKGIFIIENLLLEELSRRRVYEFSFICLPLKLRGATASPVRPVALVPQSGSES